MGDELHTGPDLRHDLDLTLEDAVAGMTATLSYARLSRCEKCAGTGLVPSGGRLSKYDACTVCARSGLAPRDVEIKVRIPRGLIRARAHGFRARATNAWAGRQGTSTSSHTSEIPKAVRGCDVVIVCLSQNSVNKRGYLQKEIRYALEAAEEQPEGTIFLIPLKLEECEIPEHLSGWQWVNFFEERGYERLMRALSKRARGRRADVSGEPTYPFRLSW